MKILRICIIILSIAFFQGSEGLAYSFLSAKCLDVNKNLFKTELCAIKGSNFSFMTKINGTLNKINVLASFHKLEKTGFRQIFRTGRIEWCSFMSGTSKANYVGNFLISTIKDSTTKELFHKCPYEGIVKVVDITMKNDKLFSIIPPGQYKVDVKIEDGKNSEIYHVEVVLDLLMGVDRI